MSAIIDETKEANKFQQAEVRNNSDAKGKRNVNYLLRFSDIRNENLGFLDVF